MRILVVSTYPLNGSRNIGDHLITLATEQMILSAIPSAKIERVYKDDNWAEIEPTVAGSDLIVFACLAVRKRPIAWIYPYLSHLMQCAKPMVVVSAGANLPVQKLFKSYYSQKPSENDMVLRSLSSSVVGFSVRGRLSSQYLKSVGVDNEYLGDVAFFDERFSGRSFKNLSADKVKMIAISDPHNWRHYLREFEQLRSMLALRFPHSKIKVFVHGETKFERYLERNQIEFVRLYNSPSTGLDSYDAVDLHVGFRVHGHVSALKRRVLSYLIEQDGRGADYGLAFDQALSVPAYFSAQRVAITLFDRFRRQVSPMNSSSINRLDAMLEHDCQNQFARFDGVSQMIEKISTDNRRYFIRVVDGLVR